MTAGDKDDVVAREKRAISVCISNSAVIDGTLVQSFAPNDSEVHLNLEGQD